MKLILIGICLLITKFNYSQCSIDYQYGLPGYYPSELPNACLGSNYQEVLQIVFPIDTIMFGNTIPIDSLNLSVNNVPLGISAIMDHTDGKYIFPALYQPIRACVSFDGFPITATNEFNKVLLICTYYIGFLGNVIELNDTTEIRLAVSSVTWYADFDEDLYGDPNNSLTSCTFPLLYVDNSLDCDDSNPAINPVATEIPDNGIDEDCDGNDLIVGLKEIEGTKVTLSPNPGSSFLHIDLSETKSSSLIKLIDINGNELLSQDFENSHSIVINTNELKAGIYFITIQIDSKLTHLKWLKIN